ncbi:alpha/beta fold hydrolase [Ignatzschineria sp. LJL83]
MTHSANSNPHTIQIQLSEASAPKTLIYYSNDAEESDHNEDCLLFLHGILGDGRTWIPYLDQFPRMKTVSLTQSGFSENNDEKKDSEDSETLFDTAIHAEELSAFCKALNQQDQTPNRKFKVVAWSYACHVALLAAQENPELFISLTLYELIVPSYGMTEEDQALFTQDLTKMMSLIIKAYRRNQPEKAMDHFISACKNAPYSLSEQAESIQIIKQDNAQSLQKLLTQKEPKAISQKDLLAIDQSVPITILVGENSRGIFQLSSKNAANSLNKTVQIIPNADHLLPEEMPEVFGKVLKDILNDAL